LAFDLPITQEDMDAVNGRIGRCLDSQGVTLAVSHISADRRRMVCVYGAADVQSVRHVLNATQAAFRQDINRTKAQ
jgi:hypothetical protein